MFVTSLRYVSDVNAMFVTSLRYVFDIISMFVMSLQRLKLVDFEIVHNNILDIVLL